MQLSKSMRNHFLEQHTGPWRHQGYIQRPDTRPIEDPPESSKTLLAE
ncbi:hypothetical protein FP2506_01975 [Fulvimarina pelagi HTCC2506]|uniref:Uncharacterized protein n=1 Tax=Fulvimarina pelagi HTCC2506 TaxID=314231 RepID=Q0FYM5_9HYPH|nr:hypothetical protein FP2506_01975 [Fulvimarina pelagi HTCC2506]